MLQPYSGIPFISYNTGVFVSPARNFTGGIGLPPLRQASSPLPEGALFNALRGPAPPYISTCAAGIQANAPFSLATPVANIDASAGKAPLSAPFVAQVLAQGANFEAMKYLQVYERLVSFRKTRYRLTNSGATDEDVAVEPVIPIELNKSESEPSHANQNRDLTIQDVANDAPPEQKFVPSYLPLAPRHFEPYPFAQA